MNMRRLLSLISKCKSGNIQSVFFFCKKSIYLLHWTLIYCRINWPVIAAKAWRSRTSGHEVRRDWSVWYVETVTHWERTEICIAVYQIRTTDFRKQVCDFEFRSDILLSVPSRLRLSKAAVHKLGEVVHYSFLFLSVLKLFYN